MPDYREMLAEDARRAIDFWNGTEGVRLHENGEDTAEGIAAFIARNPGCCFVAEEEKRVVGAILSGHDGRRGFIYHLAVAKNLRGRGIGKTLVSLATDALSRQGIRKCALFVLKENTAAQGFYRAIGFQEEDAVNTFGRLIGG